ncbi:MAG TPA: hypothetical protein VF857_11770, partial [Spirochaetota bacterium]
RITVSITDEARRLLAKKGYSADFGARELSRVIQNEVKKPLAEETLFGRLSKGGGVTIGSDGEKITFTFPNG